MRIGLKHVSILAAVVAALGVAAWADEPQGEAVRLFNGKNFDGWTFHLRDPNVKMEDVWSITPDGVIVCKGQPNGYIRTIESYDNYVLELEWRFNPEKGPGNSGVLLRMVGEDKVWPKSVEAQLMHRNAGDIWNIDNVKMTVDPNRTMGRRTVKLKESNEKPLGEWNHYRIVVDGGKIELYVNGELQNTATDVEEVAGKICLQSEGAEIHFRNIVLRPIKK
jgi:hypothetical protein